MAAFLPQHLPDIATPLPDPTSTSSLQTIHDFFLSSFYTQEKCTQLLDSYVRPTRNWGKGWDGNSFCNHQEKHVVEWNRTPFQVLTALFLFGEEVSLLTTRTTLLLRLASLVHGRDFTLNIVLTRRFARSTHSPSIATRFARRSCLRISVPWCSLLLSLSFSSVVNSSRGSMSRATRATKYSRSLWDPARP